ncbi:MAG: small nuclear ribonucleoprotein [DPANN group archaeon]|nr:small nuclear ribonucleoprotein [DPANN group archaeon]
MDAERPLDALNAARGKRVLVELKNKRRVSGVLKAFDIHINLVLEQAEERDENGEMARKLGDVFLRGDMIVLVSPSE